jgi:hypothetical protein
VPIWGMVLVLAILMTGNALCVNHASGFSIDEVTSEMGRVELLQLDTLIT